MKRIRRGAVVTAPAAAGVLGATAFAALAPVAPPQSAQAEAGHCG
jgi:hypothetical protein